MTSYLRTPGQASENFGLGTVNGIRPKGLFYVRFRRAQSETELDPAMGRRFGFVVKSVEQPKISLKTEDLNQYNKKRTVHTGYDLAPISLTVLDTLDGVARDLYQAYARHHFADFNHSHESKNWAPDAYNPEMFGEDEGFGLTVPEAPSGYFFDSIEIIQVFAGFFTRKILVNPRIISFDPDELDYEQMLAVTYRIQVSFEAVLDEDQRDIREDAELVELFGSSELDGSPLDLPGDAVPAPSRWAHKPNPIADNGYIRGGPNPLDYIGVSGEPLRPVGRGGVLGGFGEFNFGHIATSVIGNVITGRNIGNGNPLGNILRLVSGPGSKANILRTGVDVLQGAVGGVSPMVYDAARALIAARTSTGYKGQTAQHAQDALVHVSRTTNQSPSEQITDSQGMMLNPETIHEMNRNRSPGSQIGFREPPKTF